MQKITPHLWFDKEAKEAAKLYTTLFPDSKITNVTTLHNTPSGDADIVSFELSGQPFMAISAGPYFKFNPSVSFHVKCKVKDEVDKLWKKLSQGGKVLMEIGEYPWSERYGWLQDKYGLSWQLIYVGESAIKQKITPVLMFVGKVCGRAEEAVNFYTSVFKNAKADILARYGKGEEPDKEGTVKYAHFTLLGQEFGAMDSAHEHNFPLMKLSLSLYTVKIKKRLITTGKSSQQFLNQNNVAGSKINLASHGKLFPLPWMK